MQIINPFDREQRDIKTPLLKLAQSQDPVKAECGQRLLNLARQLESYGPAPRIVGLFLMNREMRLISGNGSDRITARICLDWKDYGPIHNGLPMMHYRIGVHKPASIMTEEARTQDVAVAGRMIQEAMSR